MMTGQILSGVDPQEAVKYQILITLLIGGATGLKGRRT
jgi:putative ABC transport system permease protein